MKEQKIFSLEKTSQQSNLSESDIKSSRLSRTEKSQRKMKRKPIKKAVHNVCISYKAADGTVQTIIHQKIEDFNQLDKIKGSAEKFK